MPTDMNAMMRGMAGKGMPPADEAEPEARKGSRSFTVQAPGTLSPTDEFIYEPLEDYPGAWAVYPPGVPCDTNEYRISRASPAQAGDFAEMQQALDAEAGNESGDEDVDAIIAEATEEDDGD